MDPNFTISAVGDISFEGKWADSPSVEPFNNISPILHKADLVVGNLEGPLFEGHNPVTTKTTLRGSTRWADVLAQTGFNVLSIANNHIMDHGKEGLFQTMDVLDKAGITYFGAGKDLEAASAPAFVDVAGTTRIAFLGRSSVIVSSPSYAQKDTPGIAFFNMEETRRSIESCKQKADLVILMMHWGIEEYRCPAPDQRRIAQELLQAGTDLILGHHPHVLQGAEKSCDGLVCYSLGNFLFDEFLWTLTDNEGKQKSFYSGLSPENRKSGIFSFRFSENELESYEFLPVRIDPEIVLQVDFNAKREKDFKTICRNLNLPWYSVFWQIYALRQEWALRLKPRLNSVMKLSKLRKFRPHHLRELFQLVRRSIKISNQNTTNPYE